MSSLYFSNSTKKFLAPRHASLDWVKNKHYRCFNADLHPNPSLMARAKAPTIVFFHGTGNDLFYPQLDLFDYFLSQGFRVITYDLPGHGIHSEGTFELRHYQSYLDIVAADLHTKKISPHSLFTGYSLGAFFAAELSRKFLRPTCLIGCPGELKIQRIACFTREFSAFCRALKSSQFYELKDLIPAVLSINRKKFPLRINNREILPTIAKFAGAQSKKLQLSQQSLTCFGSKDLISPASNYSWLPKNVQKKSYPTAHFDLIFSMNLMQDILDFFHEQFT